MSRSNNSGSNPGSNPGSNVLGREGYAPAPQHQQHPQQYHPPAQPAAGQWRHPLDMDDAGQPAPPPPAQWAPPHPQADPYAGQAPQLPYPQHQYAQPAPQHPSYDPSTYPAQDGYAPDAFGRGGLASYSPQLGQEPSTFAPPPQWPPPSGLDQRPDPRGYDLGEYAPGTGAQAAQAPGASQYAAEPLFSHDPYARPGPVTQRTQPPGGWQPQPLHPQHQDPYHQEPNFGPASGYADAPARAPMTPPQYPAHAQTPHAPSSHVQSAAHAPDPYRPPHGAAPLQSQVAHQHPPADDTDEMEFEEEEEAPRRGRTLLIVGALVGAIFVGGGLAYTYRALSGGGKTPMLTADKSAIKTKANSAKAPEQAPKLPDVAPKAQVASEGETGPRRVATIPVGPDGSTQSAPTPQPLAQPQTITMPGLAVTLPPPMPQREAQLPPQQPAPPVRPQPVQPPVTQAPSPVQPKVITPPQKQAALPEGAPPKETKKVLKAVPKADAYSPPGAGGVASIAPSPPPSPTPEKKSGLGAGSNGFVAAILSTPKGKLEAMKSFADLQAKFPDVLSGKPAEVQEVNLGEAKGVWYRAVVGPPGSRSAAAAVCEQLKAAGYTQCFATAY